MRPASDRLRRPSAGTTTSPATATTVSRTSIPSPQTSRNRSVPMLRMAHQPSGVCSTQANPTARHTPAGCAGPAAPARPSARRHHRHAGEVAAAASSLARAVLPVERADQRVHRPAEPRNAATIVSDARRCRASGRPTARPARRPARLTASWTPSPAYRIGPGPFLAAARIWGFFTGATYPLVKFFASAWWSAPSVRVAPEPRR